MAILALDVGGTKIKAAVLNSSLKIIKSIEVPTRAKKGKKYVLETILALISSLSSGKQNISAIGISIPGVVDAKGKLMYAGNILSFLQGFNIKTYVEKKFKLPVVVENDAACFTLAEAEYGVAKNAKLVLGVIWGSGIGACIVQRKGKRAEILSPPVEIGHVRFYDTYTKKTVELEKVAGGVFIVSRYKRLGGKLVSPTVTDIYKSKERIAQQIMKRALEHFGRELANLLAVVCPDVVVLGGGVSQAPKVVYTKLALQIKKGNCESCCKPLKLKRYGIADDAGIIGAAILAKRMK